jgi:hypothetical protein
MHKKLRYRQIATSLWGDEKFRSLSKPQANAQSLWIYILSGPRTTSVPGLMKFSVGEASEDFGWELDQTKKAMEELAEHNMIKYDQPARLLFVPNALRHNPPSSSKVIIGWRDHWAELPQCELKRQAQCAFTDYFEARDSSCESTEPISWKQTFVDAVINAFSIVPSASSTPTRYPMAYQEQDQYQKQKQNHKQHHERSGRIANAIDRNYDDEILGEILRQSCEADEESGDPEVDTYCDPDF